MAAKKKGFIISASKVLKKAHVERNPSTAKMVSSAIRTLDDRGGSSLQAIKKYLTSNYKIDAVKLAPYIKKYLKGAVISGQLIQTKGKGASGSFKFPSKASAKASKVKKTKAAKEPKTPKLKTVMDKKKAATAKK